MESRVLVVAHNLDDRVRIARALHSAGYVVELAEELKRAAKLTADRKIDAVIVATGPGFAGSEIARRLRRTVPIMLALVDAADELVRSNLSLSRVDAILARPLDEHELLTRLGELKRSLLGPVHVPHLEVYCFEGCRFDLAGRVFVDSTGHEKALTRSEAEILTFFVRNPKRVLSRDRLRRAVSGQVIGAYDRGVDVLVGRLRRKIEPAPNTPRFILTISGGGYKFMAEPQSAEHSKLPQPSVLSEPETLLRDRPEAEEKPSNVNVIVKRPEPERRQATLLGCRLVGATALAIQLDLEKIEEALDSFRCAATAAVMNMSGSIERSSGEEILAVFGYPQAHEDDAERAVEAALDISSRVGELQWPSGNAFRVQTVVATGQVLIGRGQELIGEPLAIATWLRSAPPPNSVLITAATRDALGGTFNLEGPARHELEGHSESVITYRVTGRRRARTRFEARHKEKLSRLVGRQAELQQLHALWSRTKLGNGQAALICGEPGIGKSRMFAALLERIQYEPHFTIRCQCSAHHINTPFQPIIAHLSYAAGFNREDTPERKLEKLSRTLLRAGAVTSYEMALCAELLLIPTGDHHLLQGLRPQRQKELTIAALIRQILSLSRKQPLILKLADAHWADSSTLELFGKLIASITTAPVFVLITCRPEFFAPWLEHAHVSMLRLDRLERGQARQIVADIAGDKLSDQMYEHIVKRTDGIPLFVEELTKTIIESGLWEDRVGHRPVRFSETAIPVTLADSLTARIDRLGRAKEVAQIGSAIGREFSYGLLAAVAPMSPASLRSALIEFAAPELISVRGEPPNATYIFKHGLVQDAAYATLPDRKKRHLHGLIARALEEKFPETIESQPELIAHHFVHAGLPQQAADYFRKAGQRAIKHSANAEAVGHLTRALESVQQLPENTARQQLALELQALLAQAMIAMRGYAAPQTREALLHAKALIDWRTPSSPKFGILYGIWAASYVGGVSSEQRSAAKDFHAEAQRHDDTAPLCISHRALGTTFLTGGDFKAALQHLERAHTLYDPIRHSDVRHQYGQDIGAAALCYQCWALWHLGYIDQAKRIADAAVQRAEEVAHPHTLVYTICHVRCFMGIFGRQSDDLQYWADQVVSLCAEHGFSHWMNCGRIFQGWAAICRGEIDQGVQVLAGGIADWRRTGAQLWLPTFLALEAEAYAKLGRNEAALRCIDRALAMSRRTAERWAKAELLRIKARLLFDSGQTGDQIEDLIIRSLKTARHQHARCYELRAARDLVHIRQRQNGGGEAISQLRDVYNEFSEGFDAMDLREAKGLIQRQELLRP